MRNVFLFMMISLDGYFEGIDHDLSWHKVDAEFNDFAINQLREIDTLLFGHKTYDLMASYWPTEAVMADDPAVAKLMNEIPKIVFSYHELAATWQNTRVSNDAASEVQRLKTMPGKNMAIFGSNNLCVSLMQSKLVDEFRIMINPVAIADGSALFTGLPGTFNLKRLASRNFASGNVLLTYQPQ